MKFTRLKVVGFEGLSELEFQPHPQLSLIQGHNGAGKTSVLDAIRVALTGKGGKSLLVHDGEERGLILFALDDGTEGQREVQDGGRTAGPLTLTQQGRKISAAQRFLDNLGLGFGFNPLTFIELPPHEQTKKLLEVTQLNIPIPLLIALGGGQLPGVNYAEHPLLVLKAIGDALEEQRRAVGRDARDTEGMVERLRAEVPKDFDAQAASAFDLAGAVATLSRITATRREAERIEQEMNAREQRISDLYAQIAQLNMQQEHARARHTDLLNELDELPNPDGLEAEMTAYKQNQLYLSRLHEAAEREKAAAEMRATYEALTQRIEAVRRKPAELLASTELPVQGLGVAERQVTINGLPIAALSTGEQLDVAVDIAIATLGELKVVLVDGLERLDATHQERLLERLTAAGVQAFVTKVTDSELVIVTPEGEDLMKATAQGELDEELPF